MGYATISTDPLKIINGDYLIKVIKPYTELKHGDRHDMIHALMVDNADNQLEIIKQFKFKQTIAQVHGNANV